MTYGDPSDEHRSAVKQIAKARDRALKNVSALRTVRDDAQHPNLCRIDGRQQSPLSIEATQAVVDYLLQLRPYRQNAESWGVDLGVVELPETMRIDGPRRGAGFDLFYLCRQPYVSLRGLSEIINVLNQTIIYTDDRAPSVGSSPSMSPSNTVELPDGTYTLPSGTDIAEQMLAGELTPEKVRETGRPVEEEEEPAYRPPRLSATAKTRDYKFVLPQDGLLQLVEIADEVAEEMGVLADIEQPDHSAGSRGAV